jgi:hypothetical protein
MASCRLDALAVAGTASAGIVANDAPSAAPAQRRVRRRVAKRCGVGMM